MNPDFEDLQQRIKRREKEASVLFEDGKNGHPLLEELCGYADGVLRQKDGAQWKQVRQHLHTCPDCKDQVVAVRSSLSFFHRLLVQLSAWAQSLTNARRALWVQLSVWAQALIDATQFIPKHPALVMMSLLLLLVGFFFYQQGKGVGYQDTRPIRMKAALAEGYSNADQFVTEMSRVQTDKDVIRTVNLIQVISVRANGKIYPYPIWGNRPTNAAVIADGLHESPMLQANYETYLRHWMKIFKRADVLAVEGKIDDAIQVFEYLCQAHPDDKSLLFSLGELYKMKGDHGQAIGLYEGMIERAPASQDPRPHHFLGWSYFVLERYKDAEEAYKRAFELHPRYPKLLYNRALLVKHLLLSADERARRYEAYLQEALALMLEAYQKEDDGSARIPFTLAIIFTEKQAFPQALEYLERALARDKMYVIRSEKERAFAVFQDPLSPDHEQFSALLDRYRMTGGGRFIMPHEKTFESHIITE